MIFKKSKQKIVIEARINQNDFENRKSFRYLGKTIDKNLTFVTHVSILRKKINTFCGLFYQTGKVSSKKQLTSVYNAFVQPIIP